MKPLNRIHICPDTKCAVLQQLTSEGWLCLHNDNLNDDYLDAWKQFVSSASNYHLQVTSLPGIFSIEHIMAKGVNLDVDYIKENQDKFLSQLIKSENKCKHK